MASTSYNLQDFNQDVTFTMFKAAVIVSSMEPDMSAFPVIRMDQIPYIPSELLRKATSEIDGLMQVLITEEKPKPPFLLYLQRQLDSMQAELLNRAARERIDKLLSCKGVVKTQNIFLSECSGDSGGDSISQQDQEESKKCTTSSARGNHFQSALNTNGPNLNLQAVSIDTSRVPLHPSGYKRIPLPTELVRQELSNEVLLTTTTIDTACKISLNAAASPVLMKSAHAQSKAADKHVTIPCVQIVIGAEANSDDEKNDSNSDENDDDKNDPGKEIPTVKNAYDKVVKRNIKVTRRRHKGMSNNVPITCNLLRKAAADALYKDFGSQFLVAGTERKSRRCPKIAKIETHGELLEKGRLERSELGCHGFCPLCLHFHFHLHFHLCYLHLESFSFFLLPPSASNHCSLLSKSKSFPPLSYFIRPLLRIFLALNFLLLLLLTILLQIL